MDFNSQSALSEHALLIKRKTFLHKIYIDLYKKLIPKNVPKGPVVELGSGGGFLKEIIPCVTTSDVIKGKGIDKVFFAEKMPFKDSSVSSFIMIDVLHHIKNPEKAFSEMHRCLKIGGKVIMIEPYNSLWGHFIYKYLHYEYFDPKAGWQVKGKGRMSDSNTALPWIIFVRDSKIFEKKFPKLKVLKVSGHTAFLYLISGGLTKPQFAPTFSYTFFKKVEELIKPLGKYLGMFMTIELKKLG